MVVLVQVRTPALQKHTHPSPAWTPPTSPPPAPSVPYVPSLLFIFASSAGKFAFIAFQSTEIKPSEDGFKTSDRNFNKINKVKKYVSVWISLQTSVLKKIYKFFLFIFNVSLYSEHRNTFNIIPGLPCFKSPNVPNRLLSSGCWSMKQNAIKKENSFFQMDAVRALDVCWSCNSKIL